MSDLKVIRTEEQVAEEILYYYDDMKKRVLCNSIEIGRRLIEAKEMLEHGDWGKWLEEKVKFKKSTANNYIRIFNEYSADQLNLLGDNVKFQTLGNIKYTQALELISLEEKERLEFVENHDMDSMSTRELKREIAELKKKNKEDIKKAKDEGEKEKEQILKERDKAYLDIAAISEEKRMIEESFNLEEEEKEKLENKIKDLESRIEEINNKDIEIDISKKEFEEEAQAKINALKREKEEALMSLEQYKNTSGENSTKYKIHFDILKREFKNLLEVLASMKENEAEYIKYSGATKKLLEAMQERL